MKKPIIRLKDVTRSDYKFLYDLLAQREPNAFITFKEMPSYDEHVKFAESKPYSKWCIIKIQNESVGSISLTKQNEIGIWIMKDMKGKGIGTKALEMFMKSTPRSRYLANINPKNSKSIGFFKKNGFKLIQHTYELIPAEIE